MSEKLTRRSNPASLHYPATFQENKRAATASSLAFAALADAVRSVLASVNNGPLAQVEWAYVHTAIESLPLATDDFALAINRLKNARSYSDSGETGAARFELRLLLNQLAYESVEADVSP